MMIIINFTTYIWVNFICKLTGFQEMVFSAKTKQMTARLVILVTEMYIG